MRCTLLVSVLSLLGSAVWLTGCGHAGSPPADKPSQSVPAAQNTTATEGDPAEGLKELDAADRKLAEKQKVCPVSGELLGSMGKPYKVTVKGRTFFLCCSGCEPELKKDPDKFLKKLPK